MTLKLTNDNFELTSLSTSLYNVVRFQISEVNGALNDVKILYLTNREQISILSFILLHTFRNYRLCSMLLNHIQPIHLTTIAI